MLKKLLVALVTVALAALMVASTNPSGAATASRPSTMPTIALVNEDQPSAFNGANYLFGKDFVSLVSNDSTYDWQVVSRAVAENAYADKTVSAVIVLPQSFSRDILTFQDINPVKAAIDYKVVADGELSHQRLQNEVFSILRDFNTRVVKMYFASIAGNVSGAQVNMSAVVASESALVDKLSGSLYPDLETTGKRYESSVSLAGILQKLNSGWISAQNGFTNSTTDTLTSIGDSLGRQQPSLTEYFAQQEDIARTNVTNGNTAISDQGASDKGFYDKEFSDHVDGLIAGNGAWSGFNGFSSYDKDGNRTGVLATLVKKVDEYNELAVDYNARAASVSGVLLNQQNATIEAMSQLEQLETALLKEYFGIEMPVDDSNYNVDTGSALTETLARQALAQKVASSFDTDSTATAVSAYEERIRNLVDTIPTDPAQYSELLAELQSNTAFDTAAFLRRLDLIRKYGEAPGTSSPSLHLVYPAASSPAPSVTKSLPVTVPAGARYAVNVAVPPTLHLTEVTVDLGSPADVCPAIAPDCVSIDREAGTTTVDNTVGTDPLTVTVTYDIDLGGLTGSATVAYTAQDIAPATPPAPESLGADVYLLDPSSPTKEKIGGEDFAAITAYLGNVQSAADLLHFLYGGPEESFEEFSATLVATGQFRTHSTESVFNRYGSIDASKIAERLSDGDVAAFKTLGEQHIAAIVAQIMAAEEQLHGISANIHTLTVPPLPETYFSDSVAQLNSWYTKAMASISAAPSQWEQNSNSVIQLSTIPWSGQESGKAELYLDERTGPALYESLSSLVAATSQSAKSVAASAEIITDNSAEFDELVAGVTKTKADTQAVLDAMKGTVATGTGDLAVSSEYSKRFATVFSNTRATGADPATIYDAFASPVTTTDRTPVAEPTAAAWFDYRWLVLFAAGSLIGALVCWLALRRKKNEPATGTTP
ncbi:type VII secretion protein EsaA [Leifsonia sp. 2TAF2]|uniref:type VII secretion protein EsaA n=1 Tax=Leifsonia sp. 2TAF2 TaxID=3233009 RepID=UPI003F9DC5E0